MFFYKTDNNQAKKTILTAPLDWGLGHATRCIPIIRELNALGHKVIIATHGPVKMLLQQEFPDNLFIDLRGYKVQYASKGFWLPFKLFLQFPKIATAIFKEHSWLKKIVKEYKIDLIISDNRLGLYHKTIPSIYITHQLLIKTGNYFSEKAAEKIHNWFIKKHLQCWIPDFEKGNTIAGTLSHPGKQLKNVQYIGCLSRFEKGEKVIKEYDLLIVLSGPEPQRSIFEKILLEQIKSYQGKILFVRGLPGMKAEDILSFSSTYEPNIFFRNHLPADELSLAIQQAEMVICRSGYTSIMDLVKLKQKAILVSTPGQPEQEYLADYLNRKKYFYSVSQDKFQLEKSLKKASEFQYKNVEEDMNLYKKFIHDFIGSL